MESVLLDMAGHRRSPATMPGYHRGRSPHNKGEQYPADPPTVEEIVAVMRTVGDCSDGHRLRALIVLLWRAGLRISEALAPRDCSRWNAEGLDGQTGRGRLSADGKQVYILFDWDDATKQGLIEARWDGQDRLIGRYLNLSAPEITRPWVGLIVDATRIDGEHSGGRIDFRR